MSAHSDQASIAPPHGGCVWCAYEQSIDHGDGNGGRAARVTPAVTYVRTPVAKLVANDDGWRAVCTAHARRGTWRGGPLVAT